MRLINAIIFTVTLTLASCQSDDKTPKSRSTEAAADISLRATTDIITPSPIKAASFVPNSVASWLGHIILLDDKGALHRATTDSAKTEIVALGKYTDVMGLAREKKSGVFLALTSRGDVKAFVQSDDEGNFMPIAVSQDTYSIERFCASADPTGDRVWAQTAKGDRVFSIDIFEDTSLSINEATSEADETNLCKANSALNLGPDYTLKPNNESAHLTLSKGEKDLSAEITNGLSIGGIETAGFVTVTNANMGSVFNEGVILVADENQGRLVLISLAYALKELEAR